MIRLDTAILSLGAVILICLVVFAGGRLFGLPSAVVTWAKLVGLIAFIVAIGCNFMLGALGARSD
jgi:hypothetical protein